ncbi:LacI family transcriptional regulator [Lactococcus hodotermopsidis]|uniref:LacI family transcriptional regulator n=1 Tax=Pseudolactococcus hodotermopsidis TaxID=2709157 RepID=A0A6A0BEI1_9LACT|nr:LacI family DNA-binding transcriptional regulator [Lactococcus hodotermopsidis]GFH43095.1 LacI family transcriptional regulator [Lactococcus hodotermopsidis]
MASIREIAKLAGVSPATVSRVLNADETMSVAASTRARIIKVANQLNYHKIENLGPKSPKQSSKLSIALIKMHSSQRENDDPYFRQIQEGMEVEANAWNFRLETLKLGEFKLNQLAQYGAIIVVGAFTADALAEIFEVNHNLIVVDNYFASSRYDLVHPDFAKRTEQVLDYLYAQNHRKIAFIGGEIGTIDLTGCKKNKIVDVRTTAYENWMKIHGLSDNIRIKTGNWTMAFGLTATDELIDEAAEGLPTAIISASDPMSVGIYRALQLKKIAIPETISIFSFDDIEVAGYMSPPLSTVHIDSLEIGRVAIRLAKERILDNRTSALRVEVASEIIVRESVMSLNFEK